MLCVTVKCCEVLQEITEHSELLSTDNITKQEPWKRIRKSHVTLLGQKTAGVLLRLREQRREGSWGLVQGSCWVF